jgi:hypothetical protein
MKKPRRKKPQELSAWLMGENISLGTWDSTPILFNGKRQQVFYEGDKVDTTIDLGQLGMLHIHIQESP